MEVAWAFNTMAQGFNGFLPIPLGGTLHKLGCRILSLSLESWLLQFSFYVLSIILLIVLVGVAVLRTVAAGR